MLGRDVVYKPVSSQWHLEILPGAGVPEQFAGMAVAVDGGIREARSRSGAATSPA